MKIRDLPTFFQSQKYEEMVRDSKAITQKSPMIAKAKIHADNVATNLSALLGIVGHLTIIGMGKEATELLEDAIKTIENNPEYEADNNQVAYHAEASRLLGYRRNA
jgi:hypothetical protein